MAVGVGLVVAVAALFTGPSQQAPAPVAPSSAGGHGAPSSAQGGAYRLSDPLPFSATPVWHAAPSAEYRLTAAPDELRYVSDSGCRLSFRAGPLHPSARASPSRTTPVPSVASTSSASASPDPETAATRTALADAVEAVRGESSSASVTDQGLVVVTTLGSPGGALVDMAGAALRIGHADGSVTYVRLAVRAVPSAQSSVMIAAECPQPEQAATAMNHASVHSYLAGT
ncbi:hypothetical protein GCM10027449_19530 [Sinomonas notoginsengisoli]